VIITKQKQIMDKPIEKVVEFQSKSRT
jgi:hypothetical protein